MKRPSHGKRRADFFERALDQAAKASKKNEIPIGAVLVKNGELVAVAHNKTESRGSFLAHAEILCIQAATKKLNSKFLNDCEIFVTLEPCLMCHAAASLSRIKAIHYLASSKTFGRKRKAYSRLKVSKSKSRMTLRAAELLQAFFKNKR